MANVRNTHNYYVNGRRVSLENLPGALLGDFHDNHDNRASHDYRPSGSADMGTPYEEVPVSVGPSSSGGSTIFSSLFGLGGRTNTNAKAKAEAGYSARGTSGAGNRKLDNHGGPKSEHSEYPSRVFESKGVDGDYSRTLGDLPRFSVQEETSSNELKVSHQKIASLENRNKQLEEDLLTEMTKFHYENGRADGFERENREMQRKLEGLSREKVRADGFERENREMQRKLEGLSREKMRADAFEKENREMQRKLEGLSREKMRADGFEKESREMQMKLEGLSREKMRADGFEIENREMQMKLEGLSREKVRADGFEKENREMQMKLEGLSREKMRADAFEKENREMQMKLEGLSQEKVRADGFEKENREMQMKLEGLSREKMRADGFEKEYREIQRKLETLSLEKVRADSFESENREYQVKLKKDEQEIGELQSKLQDALAAKELKVADSKTLQNSLKGIRLENQELNSWKLERERKTVQDTSPVVQYRTKVADLTYAKGQLEKKEKQLTNQIQEQTKRIEDLKQQNAVLVVKMGALESQVQSLLERLHDEREKVQQRNIEVEELKQQLKPQVIIADKEAQVDEQEARERALRVQCSALEQQVQSKELETRSLSLTLSKLNERLRQCDLEIDDLKHQPQDRQNGDSQDFAVAPPKQYIGGESFLESAATPYLLDGAVQRVHEGAGIFSRLLMKAMEQGKIDGMAVARNNFVRSISVGKAAPLKYVLEAITCKLLFQSFEHECFDLQDSSSGFLDMDQQRMDSFRQYEYLKSIEFPEQLVLTEDSLFTHFCRMKLECLSAAIPEIESMIQEVISRTFDRSFSSDDTSTDIATYLASKLGSTFVKLAVCVWQVHKLAFAFNPVARIFRVPQGEKFVEKYMESVIFQESESEDEDMSKVDISRVDFMVVPGFLINRIVIRSRVFVVTKPMLSAFQYRSGDIQSASM